MSRNVRPVGLFRILRVAPREGRVSRNRIYRVAALYSVVAPREGRVSRNLRLAERQRQSAVAPREGRVSRNVYTFLQLHRADRRAPRGACE